MFEKKKKNKAHIATKAHKLTLSFPTASHKITIQRSFNEVHVGALLWQWIAHLNTYPHYTGSFGALSDFLLAVDCIACFSRDALDYFSIADLTERSVDRNLGRGAAWDYIFLGIIIFFSFLSSFIFKNYFL